MTGRERRGSSPGRSITGALAMTALVVIGAQVVLAGQDKPKEHATHKSGAAKPGSGTQTAPQQPAPAAATTAHQDRQTVRTIGGVQVAIDPATGKLQPPTADEAASLAAGLQRMLSRETDGLQVIILPDGTQMVSLDDTFQDVAIATKGKRGNTTLRCVNDGVQAARLLAGTAPEIPDTINLTSPADKRGIKKPAKTNLEKE
jgi:hypothetical protein